MSFKILITTSGVGSRLGDSTKYTNKSLMSVGKKPVLSCIIEKYAPSIPLVITVGHYGEHVIEFCKLAYPERNITFVNVNKYEGEGSSLGYSMLQAKNHLQTPFIFHAGDTIIEEDIPSPEKSNWSAGFKGGDSSQYTSFVVQDRKITEFLPKGSDTFDYIHVGLVGIKDYESFWEALQKLYNVSPNDQSLNDVAALKEMISKGSVIDSFPVQKWHDVGNIDSLRQTRQQIADELGNLHKDGESIYLINNHIIKFFHDEKKTAGRIERAKLLKDVVPAIVSYTRHFYKYKYVEGNSLSKSINAITCKAFLLWAQKHLFEEIKIENLERFYEICKSFYKTKTMKRISDFYAKYNFTDREEVINGNKVPKLIDLLGKIDFDNWLCKGIPCKFHGDLHFNNIIEHTSGFTLFDWREDFGGIYEYGDVYYDLAKLYHGIIVNHPIVRKNLFILESKNGDVVCDILRPQLLVDCEKIFLNFLSDNNYDVKKVKVLTALVYLNAAPLHHHPYDKFLYYFGKQMLHTGLQ